MDEIEQEQGLGVVEKAKRQGQVGFVVPVVVQWLIQYFFAAEVHHGVCVFLGMHHMCLMCQTHLCGPSVYHWYTITW